MGTIVLYMCVVLKTEITFSKSKWVLETFFQSSPILAFSSFLLMWVISSVHVCVCYVIIMQILLCLGLIMTSVNIDNGSHQGIICYACTVCCVRVCACVCTRVYVHICMRMAGKFGGENVW